MKADKAFILLFCLLTIIQAPVKGQALRPDSLKIGEISAATVDLFDNLYLADQQGQILKITPQPLHVDRYSGKQTLGYHIIDAGSFNKVAVFSIDLQTVRFFDKNLNPLSELSLNPAFGSSITCVCLSSDNNLWIFDETGPGLKKIDPVTGRVLQTIDCSNTLKEGELSISDMKEYKNRLYMLDGDHNVYEFNFMGNLLRTFRLPGSRHLQFHGDYLISASSGHLLTYNLDDGLSGEKLFDDAKAKSQIYFGENYIYEVSKNIVILPAGQGFYKNIF